MLTSRCHATPGISNFKDEAHDRELSYGRRNIFLPLHSPRNPNAKYMIRHDQFKNQVPPILKFFSQYDDSNELPRDQMKYRNCHIFYYVEDGTIKVYEPPQRNSGLNQGYLVTRNRIPKPDGGFYCLDDLNIGKTLVFYGKKFKILDCEPFTKNYLKEMGYRVGSPEPEVVDPVYLDRKQMDMPHLLGKTPKCVRNKSLNFFKFHPKCLRFFVIYNYKPRYLQDICYASLYYSIVDNTIKIVDEKKLLDYQKQLSAGMYDTYLILKPTLVPKMDLGSTITGDLLNPTILNLAATTRQMALQEFMIGRSAVANSPVGYLTDSNPSDTSDKYKNYYTTEDLDIGKTLDIFGTKVFIHDCDEFTKEFYRHHYSKELIPVPLPDIQQSEYHQLIYKNNFGIPEATLQAIKANPPTIVIRKLIDVYSQNQNMCHVGSKSNNLKFYLNGKNGLDSKVLKVLSKVVTEEAFLNEHYFVIQYFREDDTMQVNGLDLRFANSSSNNGPFLKRMKVTKPKSEETNFGPCYYSPKDLFVGNVIYIMKRPFVILDADEYTYDYMERHCDAFPNSNIKDIIHKLFPVIRDKAGVFSNSFDFVDLDKTGFVPYNDFRNILFSNLPEDTKASITEHQVKTLARFFAQEDYIGLKYDQLLSKIQYELKKKRFQEFEKLDLLFRLLDTQDSNPSGHFEPDRVYNILRSYPLVVDRDLLKSFVFKFPSSNGLISYKKLTTALNYFENPSKSPDQIPYAININWERVEMEKNINKISYRLFLKELNKEKCPSC